MDYKTLSNGVKIPSIGYGTYKTPAGEVCVDGVRKAVETGYRLIDTAAFYGNEESVKDGVIDSKVCRNDILSRQNSGTTITDTTTPCALLKSR